MSTRTTHVAIIRPGRALVISVVRGRPDGEGFDGGIIRDGRDYQIEDSYGNTIGRARSYRAGADRLARHYGHPDAGHVEISYERDARGWSGDAGASRAAATGRRCGSRV